MKTSDILTSYLDRLNIDYTARQIYLTEHYLELVYQYNKNVNIVGTKDKKEILVRHFLDCISILKYRESIFSGRGRNKLSKVLDVGTGAGLPGILLAIFLPDKFFYLMDKRMKKIEFLKKAIKKLGISNVETIRGRAEELSHDNSYRESFDIVLARAVAKFNILCELVIPFCKINGKIIFYKSKKVFEELKVYGSVIVKLGGKIDTLQQVEVPGLYEFRAFLIINKEKSTPLVFPRAIKKINRAQLT